MKVYFPVLRWLTIIIGCTIPVYQQYYWFTHGGTDKSNWFAALTWFCVCVGIVTLIALQLFPTPDKNRHKFRVTFYCYDRIYYRVCTRSYTDIWKFCFKQLWRTKSSFFIIKQLDIKK